MEIENEINFLKNISIDDFKFLENVAVDSDGISYLNKEHDISEIISLDNLDTDEEYIDIWNTDIVDDKFKELLYIVIEAFEEK